MARYQLTLAYDGTDFFGSQRQVQRRTVQGELEKALEHLSWTGGAVLLSGRTDTGVHATGQVAAFDLDWSHSDEELVRALNAALPADLAVRQVRRVPADFHPRFDAIARRYEYRLFCQPLRDPLRERFAWRVWPSLRTEALAEAAGLFLGTHDFSAFGSPTTPRGGTVRTVWKAEWSPAEEGAWRFNVQADAFLYRMVRRLVFIQVAVSQGKLSAEAIAHAFEQRPAVERRRPPLPGGLAPAHGLTLVEVAYRDRESMGQSEKNLM